MRLPAERPGLVLTLFLACLLFFANAGWTQSQATTGILEGTVTDPTGAVVPGAKVFVENQGTGFTRESITDSSGFFRVGLLPLGTYRITAEHPGFATLRMEAVPVTLGKSSSVKLQLRVASPSEQVVVAASEASPTTTQTETTSALDEQVLQDLPSAKRDYRDFLFLTPNVHTSMGSDGIQIHINGQKNVQTGFFVDGGNANNAFFGQQRGYLSLANTVLEAVQEFQVISEGASAELGGYSGAFVNVVTKSGSNLFRGSLFHQQELEALTGRLADDSTLRGYHREQFGGSAGGPIRKDKLFFFGAYEQTITRFKKENDIVHCCVVSDAQGIASLAPPSAGGLPVDFGALFASRFGSPEAGPIRHTYDSQGFLLKGDWIPQRRHALTVRHSFARSVAENHTFDVPTFGRTANGSLLDRSHSFIGAWNWTISPRYLNEFRFQYGRENLVRSPNLSPDLPDTSFGSCTQPLEFAPPPEGCLGRTFRFGHPFFLRNATLDELFQVSEDFSYLSGRHAIKAGFNFNVSRIRNLFQPFSRGLFVFDTAEGFLNYINFGPTFVECSGGSASVVGACPATEFIVGPLLGYLQFAPIGNTTREQASGSRFLQVENGIFLQDTWQPRSGLTISLGFRWDNFNQRDPIIPPTQSRIGQFLDDPSFPSAGTVPGFHRAFQPRVGIAWALGTEGKTVLRANGGIFFARLPGIMVANAVINNGSLAGVLFTASFFNAFGQPPPAYPDCATGAFTPPACPVPPGFQPADPNVILFARDFVYPRTYQWSIWLERQVAQNWTLSVGFNYALATHLNRITAFNHPPPIGTLPDGRAFFGFGPGPFSGPNGSGSGIGSLSNLITSDARALYRAVTFRVDRKMTHNFLLSVHYTYSRDIDDDSNEANIFDYQFGDPRDFHPERGPSNRDQRHQFAFYGVWRLPWDIQWSHTMTARSASPRSLLCNFDANADGGSNDRVYTDGQGSFSCGPAGAGRRVQLSEGEFVTLAAALSGGHDTGRNRFRRNDPFFDWSMRLQKDWVFRERYRLEPALEVLNVTGNNNLRFPICDELRGCFVGTILQIPGEPRRLRLGLRFEW